jgi:hypothetical protein
MYKIFLSLILLLATTLQVALADEPNPNLCFNTNWPVHKYIHAKSGEASIYEVPDSYTITSTNLACVIASEFVSQAKTMPNRMLVGLVSSDGRQAFLARWDLTADYFTFIEVTIDRQEYLGQGTFTTYPQPLKRIKDIITSTKFPTKNELPAHLKHKLKANNFNASVFQVKGLLSSGDLK